MLKKSESIATDALIIGAGPCGLFAVFELGLLDLKCHLIDILDRPGGQCAELYPEKPIYDIPGYPRVMAQDLVDRLAEQAAPFDPIYHLGQQVIGLQHQAEGQKHGKHWRLTTSKGTVIEATAVIIAAGCGAFGPNRPPLEGIEAYDEGRLLVRGQLLRQHRLPTAAEAASGDRTQEVARGRVIGVLERLIIVTLVLMGQVLELRARAKTSSAIRALLKLAPKVAHRLDDRAVAPACVTCHNDHKDSPKRDFKLNDVMGGVVLRIPISG